VDFNKIKYLVDDGVASITLNCPENLNAFNELMIDDVLVALELCKNDEEVKVVVISAEGKAFSGGGDIREMYDGLMEGRIVFETTVGKIAQVSLNIKKLNKPVITAVSGAVAGAAFNIILASDFCIAAENSKFIQSFVNIGLIPDAGGVYLLTRAVGVNRATQLMFTGKPVSAEEALDLGIIYKRCELDKLKEETFTLAKKLAGGPIISYAYMKSLIYASQFSDFEDYITKEVDAQLACGHTKDFKEGITAFIEKRKPIFTGK
jgi:enoyl-CoA hydratase/carnithine racemase